jgi:Trk-type K+ transport system membrane component
MRHELRQYPLLRKISAFQHACGVLLHTSFRIFRFNYHTLFHQTLLKVVLQGYCLGAFAAASFTSTELIHWPFHLQEYEETNSVS